MTSESSAAPETGVDPVFYSQASGTTFSTARDAYQHYREIGHDAGLNPSPYFFSDWHAWRNPSWKNFATPLDHFLATAASQVLDPAPFVDSVALMRADPRHGSSLELYQNLVAGAVPTVSPNLKDHLHTLESARRAFHARIELGVLRDTGKARRNLVWVQSGRAFKPAEWFRRDAPRSWDLLCNWYDLTRMDLRFGEIVLRQSGTKFTGISQVLAKQPELLQRYDRVLFLDDDLEFQHADLDTVFAMAEKHDLDLFQPAVAKGSHCVWPALFQQPRSEIRLLTGVEIMMFGFSQRALAHCTSHIHRSVSGFGLDLACGEAVRGQGWQCGIIDAVAAQHREEINEAGGSYYEFMRKIGVNQQLELYEVMAELGQRPNFQEVR